MRALDFKQGHGLTVWSFVFLGATACVFLSSQIHMTLMEKEGFTVAYDEARQKAGSLNSSVKQAEAAYQKRAAYLERVAAAQERRLGLLNDLLELSKIDPDARALVHRWKVTAQGQMQVPQGGGTSAQETPLQGGGAQTTSPPPAQFAPKPVDKPEVPAPAPSSKSKHASPR